MYGGQRAYAILLAVIAAAILVGGFLLKPAPRKSEAATGPELTTIQQEVSRLREIAQRNTLRSTGTRFNAAANDAARHAVLLLPAKRPAWMIDGEGTLMSAEAEDLRGSLQATQGGSTAAVVPEFWGAGLHFATARPQSKLPASPATSIPLGQISPGAWILLVSLNESGEVVFSPGNYGGQSTEVCGSKIYPVLLSNIPLNKNSVGAGIFDFDGNMLAMVIRCDQDFVEVPLDTLRSFASESQPELAMLQLGFRATPIDERWRPLLNASKGLVVTDVWQGWPAAEAGVNPGDILGKIKGLPVENIDQVASLLKTGDAKVDLDLRRGGALLHVQLVRRGSGVEVQAEPTGLVLKQVLAGTGFAQAGFRSGDRILAVNGRKATPANIDRILSPDAVQTPTLVIAQQGNRKFARVVAP